MSFFSQIDEDWHNRILKGGFVLLVVLIALFAVMTVNQIQKGKYIGESPSMQNTIAVSGSGEAAAVPNSARFTVAVINEAETVGQAQERSTQEINSIISYLEDAGVQKENIKTVNYNISPRYEYQERVGIPRPSVGQRQLVDYEVSQRLQVTTDETDQAGELLSGVGERGADDVSSLSFVVEDQSSLEREATVDAITKARENARQLADALGVDLVRVVGFSESGSARPYRLETAAVGMGGDAQNDSSPRIPTGESRVEAQVQITYEIK